MISAILKTEFEANRLFIAVTVVANIFLMSIFFVRNEQNLANFIAATSLVFYIQLIVIGILSGEQKRNQLYARLPVTRTDYFVGSWLFILSWLAMQIGFWLIYGVIVERNFIADGLDNVLGAGLGIAILISLVAIAIDLWSFKPVLVRWVYLGLMLTLLAVAIHLDVSVGVVESEGRVNLYPFAILIEAGISPVMALSLALAALAGLLLTDYAVYTHSENYLS